MNEFERLLANAQNATGTDALLWIALRIVASALFGAVVAALYRASRRPDARRPAFAQTLVLLAPLIAMVTMAVGQNVAAAFTLVGTLAIVRFRTVVRDTRDMAYVIFAVAVGMALGAFNVGVAVIGSAVVACVVLVLRWLELRTPDGETATLKLVITPPEADPSVYRGALERFASSHGVVRSAINRQSGELELYLSVADVDPDRSPELLTALLESPDVLRASFQRDDAE